MARILYALSGEGRGHATRAATIVDALAGRHAINLFAPGLAYGLLADRFRDGRARVEPIDGLRFTYRKNGRLSLFGTAAGALAYLRRLPSLIGALSRRIRDERPDLCITDFDPALPRAAERCGVPYLSVDHQHFLAVSDFSGFPKQLRPHIAAMGRLVRCFYRRQALSIVSSFAFPPVRDGVGPVLRTGVMLRPEVLAASPERRGHLCVYLRRAAPSSLLESLERIGCPTRIYGLGAWPRRGQLEFIAVDERRFVEDLANCRALISTAGNQLVGEALWLGKPVLAIPEAGNAEQRINAHLLRDSGGGDYLLPEQLDVPGLRAFVDNAESYVGRVPKSSVRGNEEALAAIEGMLGHASPRVPHSSKVAS